MVLYSDFALNNATTFCFLLFQDTKFPPTKHSTLWWIFYLMVIQPNLHLNTLVHVCVHDSDIINLVQVLSLNTSRCAVLLQDDLCEVIQESD